MSAGIRNRPRLKSTANGGTAGCGWAETSVDASGCIRVGADAFLVLQTYFVNAELLSTLLIGVISKGIFT